MSAGKFAEGQGDSPADEGGENEGEDDGRAGEFDSRGGSEQEAGADRAPDRDHGHLCGIELVAQAEFWVGGRRSHGGLHRKSNARFFRIFSVCGPFQ